MARNQKDYYYYKAHNEGYRSRASYKLKQINEKEHIIKKKDNIVDLGASPGGWLQVARELSTGKVIGVDIQYIEPLENVITIKNDIREESTKNEIMNICNFNVDVVLCDAAPNLTGNWNLDHCKGIELNEHALDCAVKILKKGGNFVVKVFQGDLFLSFYKRLKSLFQYVKAYSPNASRSTSSEIYIICKRYLKIPVKINDEYNVIIETIGKNGDYISYIENFVVFIKKNIKNINIGDNIPIKIIDVKLNYCTATIISEIKEKIKIENNNNEIKNLNNYFIDNDDYNDEYEKAF